MPKLIFVDLETTGTDPQKHGIIQLAGQIWIDGVEKERFDFRMKPLPGQLVNKEALEVNGVTLNDIRDYPEPAVQFREFRKILAKYVSKYDRTDKFMWIGYAANFDNQFLRKWFELLGDKFFGSWFYFPYLDCMVMAAVDLMNERHTMENFKLRTVCKQFGIEVKEEELHQAQHDVSLTVELFNLLMARRRMGIAA